MPKKTWSLLLLIRRLMHALSAGEFLRCMVLSLIFVLTASNLLIASDGQSDDSEGPPNIVLIVADDLGFGDVKCFGQDRCLIPTPFLDRIAGEGIRYTNAYSSASVCVPSRMSIMTGRYAFRYPPPVKGGDWGFIGVQLPTKTRTLGSMLHQRGYETGYVGKWHLGTLMDTYDDKIQNIGTVDYSKPIKVGPKTFGFTHSFILPGSLDMYPYAFVRDHHWVGDVTAVKGWSAFARMGPASHDFEDTSVLSTLASEATRFIQSKRKAPFFLFVGLTAPHTPSSPTNSFRGRSQVGVYGDYVMNTDYIIGSIVNALKKVDRVNNTLVIITSDHGPASYAGLRRKAISGQMKAVERLGHYSRGPYRGYKFSAYDGGMRVPLILRWPNRIAPSQVSEQVISLVDIFATIDQITERSEQLENNNNAAAPAPDSFSLFPPKNDEPQRHPRPAIIMEGTRSNAIRQGNWKLILGPGSGSPGRWGNTPAEDAAWKLAIQTYGKTPKSTAELEQYPFVQLYHLEKDPAETTNLASVEKEKVADLVSEMRRLIASGHSHPNKEPVDSRKIPLFKYIPGEIKKAIK